MLGRYFYFESNGSSSNPGNHLVEVQIVDTEGINRALGRGVLRYSGGSGSNASKVTDGDTSYNNFFDFGEGKQHVVIDLGAVYDISYIKVWRYYSGGRAYKGVFIKVSKDDVNYTTVFSSEVDGTYAETAEGKQINILNFDPTVPIFRMPLKDSLEYTGESFTVSVSGSDDIVFEENAFSATTHNQITIDLPTAMQVFTIFLRFKIYSNGVPPEYQLRRLIWGYDTYSDKLFGTEIAYSGSTTTNKLFLSKAFTDALDDGNWHTCVVKKEGSTITCTVDDTYTDTVSGYWPLQKIVLSQQSYVLNGLIKDVRIYKHIVDEFDETKNFGMGILEGEALPISGGMAKVNGVVLPITGGMTKTGGVVTPITM